MTKDDLEVSHLPSTTIGPIKLQTENNPKSTSFSTSSPETLTKAMFPIKIFSQSSTQYIGKPVWWYDWTRESWIPLPKLYWCRERHGRLNIWLRESLLIIVLDCIVNSQILFLTGKNANLHTLSNAFRMNGFRIIRLWALATGYYIYHGSKIKTNWVAFHLWGTDLDVNLTQEMLYVNDRDNVKYRYLK